MPYTHVLLGAYNGFYCTVVLDLPLITNSPPTFYFFFFASLWSAHSIHLLGTPFKMSRSVTALSCLPCTMTSRSFDLPGSGVTTQSRRHWLVSVTFVICDEHTGRRASA